MANDSAVFIWMVSLITLIIFIIREIRSPKECPRCGSRMSYDSHADNTFGESFLCCPVCGYKKVLGVRELDK